MSQLIARNGFGKHKGANKDAKIYVGRSTAVYKSYTTHSYSTLELRNQMISFG